MSNQPWLDEVMKRMAGHGLPPNYVQRFAEELSDHLADFKEENMSTDADVYSRLGKPEQVAQAAVVAYRRRSFLGRHPTAAFFVFAVSPVIPLIILGIASFTLIDGLCCIFWSGFNETLEVVPYMMILGTIAIPSMLVSSLYCSLAQWLGIGKKWIFVSGLALAAMAAIPTYYVDGRTLWLNPGFHSPIQFGQFILPLATACWFMKRKCDLGIRTAAFLVFAISPVVSFIILWGVTFFVFCLIAGAIAGTTGITVDTLTPLEAAGRSIFAYAAALVTLILPAVLLCALYGQFAKRLHASRKWAYASLVLLATLAGLSHYSVTPDNMFCLDIGFYSIVQLSQFLVPLLIGLWFMRRMRDQGRLQLAS